MEVTSNPLSSALSYDSNMSRDEFIESMIAALQLKADLNSSPPLSGEEIYRKLSFDFPVISSSELKHVTELIRTKLSPTTPSSYFSLNQAFLNNLSYLSERDTSQSDNKDDYRRAIADLHLTIYLHLPLQIFAHFSLPRARTFLGALLPSTSEDDLSPEHDENDIDDQLCALFSSIITSSSSSSFLLSCFHPSSLHARANLQELISLLQLLYNPPSLSPSSSSLPLTAPRTFYSTFSTFHSLLLDLRAFYVRVYRDIVLEYPSHINTSLLSVIHLLQPSSSFSSSFTTSNTLRTASMNSTIEWLELLGSISASLSSSFPLTPLATSSQLPGSNFTLTPSILVVKTYLLQQLDFIVVSLEPLLSIPNSSCLIPHFLSLLSLIISSSSSASASVSMRTMHNQLTDEEIYSKIITSRALPLLLHVTLTSSSDVIANR